MAVFCFFGVGSVSAITYQGEVNVRFTFNDVLSLTVDDELIDVGTLLPGSSAVSDPITLTVNTNYLYGYKLLATVGDTTHDYRELMREDGEQSFVSLAVDSDVATLPDGDSVWGYAKSVDGGTTWSNYSGLPKYDSNAKLLNSSNGAAVNATTNFRVGAKVKNTQAPGTYSNVINFVLLTNPSKIYLQDVTSADCTSEEKTVYDRRDETEYTIKRVYGTCWIMQNLRLNPLTTSLEQLQGNTNASDTTLDYFKNGGGRNTPTYKSTHFYGTAALTDTWGNRVYSVPQIYTGHIDEVPSNGYQAKAGVYYNFCAATAGSFCMGSGTNSDSWTTPNYPTITEDICPSGWRLPVDAEFTNVYTQAGNGTAGEAALHLPRAGNFNVTMGNFGGWAYYYASTMHSSSMHDAVMSNNSGWEVGSRLYRYYGAPVRCVLKES